MSAVGSMTTMLTESRGPTSETVRLKASESILDRASPEIAPKRQIHTQEAGHAPNVTVNYIDMTRSQIDFMNQYALEEAKRDGIGVVRLLPPSTAKLAVIHDQYKQVLAEKWVDADGKLVELDVVQLELEDE